MKKIFLYLVVALSSLSAFSQAKVVAITATPSNDDIIQRKSGLWVPRTIAQFKADMNLTADVILNQTASLQTAQFAITGPIKIGTFATLDARTKSLFVDNSTAASSFALSEWKANGDDADLNFEGGAGVKHSKSYNLTYGYAGTYQMYGLAGAWGTIIGNNSFTGNTLPYSPTIASQPNSYIRFELGPLWPESEKMRINNSGDIIFGTTVLRNYDASQTATSTVNDPVNVFSSDDALPGRYLAWGANNGGLAAYMDKITAYTDANNITVERVRTIASQKARVVEANSMIDTLGNAYFKVGKFNELRLSQYGSSYYKWTQDAAGLNITRVGSSTPDTLLNLTGFSRIAAPRDLQLNGGISSAILFKDASTSLFSITSNATNTLFNNLTSVATEFQNNGTVAFRTLAAKTQSKVPFMIGGTDGEAAIAKLDVRNPNASISFYVDNTRASGTNDVIRADATAASTENRAIYATANGGTTDKAIMVPSSSGSGANDYGLSIETTGKNYLAGKLGIGVSDAGALFHALGTTEQVRTGFDASNYESKTISSSGSATYELTGTSPQFTFGKQINITGGLVATGVIQSSTTNTSSNFAVLSGTSFATTTLAQLLPTGASQIKARVIERGTTNTALATNDSYIGDMIGEMGVTEAGAGTHFLISSAGIRAPAVTTGAAASTNTSLLFLDIAGTTGTNNYGLFSLSKIGFDATITAGGTTGNQTINKPSGTVNIAAAGTTVTVTNSLVTTSSIVYAMIRTADATATIKNVVPASGSFVINLGAAATAEISVGFIVYN